MRYLKAIAQDLSGNGKPDTVILHFYRQACGHPDEIIHEVIVNGICAKRKVSVQDSPDLNQDGESNAMDRGLLDTFANAFLALKWFNRGNSCLRVLTVYEEYLHTVGGASAVRLHLKQRAYCRSWVYPAAGYDLDDDGELESFTYTDMNDDGVVDHTDLALIRRLCNTYRMFRW